MSHYCQIHNIHHSSYFCPRCEAEKRHEELVELTELAISSQHVAAEEAIYKQANPGEYKCPSCLYITLKRGASRCPRCHATIGTEHWISIYEHENREQEERKRRNEIAAEEWAKGEPERQRRARATKRANSLDSIVRMHFRYLPALTMWTVYITEFYTNVGSNWTWQAVTNHFSPISIVILLVMFVPYVKWLAFFAILWVLWMNDPLLGLWIIIPFSVWAILGGFGYGAAKAVRRRA